MELLDARGYEVKLETSGEFVSKKIKVNIKYLGADTPEPQTIIYRNDKYVVSYVENESFTGTFFKVLKDSEITSSGLKISIQSDEETEIKITVCGEVLDVIHLLPSEVFEKTYSTDGLCAAEKEYLNKVHSILYKLLAEIDRVCTENDIQYFLVFGGLLGYLRHGEIIPWDDDVDIAMTRKNFEKFKKIANDKLGEEFRFLDADALGEDAFLDFLCRVIYMKEDVEYNAFDKISGRISKEYMNKIPMDIYILDNASDIRLFHKIHMLMIRVVYGLAMGHRAYLNMEEYGSSGYATKKGIEILSHIGRIIPLRLIMKMHDRVSMRFNRYKTRNYFMSNGYLPFIHTKYKRKWFEKTKKVKLGEVATNIPGRYRSYLKRAYYDYYHLPPVSKRIPGHKKLVH